MYRSRGRRRAGAKLSVAPITLVAPTSPGGPPDTIGRILGERMKVTLGQPVIVENVTGAGGSLGVQRVARAAPDGYTVSIGHLNSHVFTGASYNLSFDLLKDLAPVTLLTSAPMVFVARSDFAPNSVQELIAWMKEVRRAPRSARSVSAVRQRSGPPTSRRSSASNSSSCPIAARPRSCRT